MNIIKALQYGVGIVSRNDLEKAEEFGAKGVIISDGLCKICGTKASESGIDATQDHCHFCNNKFIIPNKPKTKVQCSKCKRRFPESWEQYRSVDDDLLCLWCATRKGIQLKIDKKAFKEKLLLIVKTIRNHQDIKQVRYRLKGRKQNEFCILGLLGYRAGLPRDDLNNKTTTRQILERYGITANESIYHLGKANTGWLDHFCGEMNYSLSMIWDLNDGWSNFGRGWSFDKIADWIEQSANNL